MTHYEPGADFIKVEFIGGAVYRYTYASAGRANVETMKSLAKSGVDSQRSSAPR